MLHRALGQTGLNVSVIGFGASPLGNVFGTVSLEQGKAAVLSAIEHGINFFDVSPYYGMTLAEMRLGEALIGRRNDIVLATKCGRYGTDMFDFSAATVTREFELSLLRLKTDYIDLLQIHDVEFGLVDQIVEETLPALRIMQDAGKIRFVGITSYWPGLLASIAARTKVDTILNYCHSNLLIRDMDDELTPLAERRGIGLINASPLHMGLLGGGAVADWHPASSEVRKAAEQIQERCRAYGLSPASIAIAWCTAHPVVATTLVGISSVQQVDEACNALQLSIPEELLVEIREIAVPVYNKTWRSGLPENQPSKAIHAG